MARIAASASTNATAGNTSVRWLFIWPMSGSTRQAYSTAAK